MTQTEAFLTAEEEQRIVAAIVDAENQTSGEIRVHIEQTHTEEPIKRAQQIFHHLEMHKTDARNGVLFYVNVAQRTFAIIGDEGIDTKVPNDFWDCTKDLVIQHFKNQQFATGLIEGVKNAGVQLQKYFPVLENNPNELPNELSKS